jgi:hypothetical protein
MSAPTVVRVNTHCAACVACGAPVVLALESTGTVDAIATVSRGAAARTLPVLPEMITWECPACDARQTSGEDFADAAILAALARGVAAGIFTVFDPATA